MSLARNFADAEKLLNALKQQDARYAQTVARGKSLRRFWAWVIPLH